MLPFSGRYHYLIVSKNGFTEQCLVKMNDLGILHLNLREITALFNEIKGFPS
jgi:hypothetical protein